MTNEKTDSVTKGACEPGPSAEAMLYERWARAVREAKALEAEYTQRAALVGQMERWRDEAHGRYTAKVSEVLSTRRALEANLTLRIERVESSGE